MTAVWLPRSDERAFLSLGAMHLLSPVELDEVTSQADMAERGKRLTRFKERTATHVWRYLPDSGYWVLDPVIDGTVPL